MLQEKEKGRKERRKMLRGRKEIEIV